MQRYRFRSFGPILAVLKVRSTCDIRPCHSGPHVVKYWLFPRMETLLEISTGFRDFMPDKKSSTSALGSHGSNSELFLGNFLQYMGEHAFPSWQTAGPTRYRFAQLCFSVWLLLFPSPPLGSAQFRWTSARSCPATEVIPFWFGKVSGTFEVPPETWWLLVVPLRRVCFTHGSYTSSTMALLLP